MEMMEKRISDGSVLQLIRKWIKVGVIEQGRLLVSETGTGQGQTISPLLANIYLHYVLDEWFEKVVKPRLRGEAHEIRFADDAVLCFQYREDAEKVMSVLAKAVRQLWADASPGEDAAGGIWATSHRKRKAAGEETGHIRLPWVHAHLRTQPTREIHSARADDAQTAPSGPEGGRPMVPGAQARPCGRATKDPQRQTSGPLPVLRAPDELPGHREVLSEGSAYLAYVAQSPHSWGEDDVGEV